MCRLVIDLQAQAAYIESDGDGIQIDFLGDNGWMTKELSKLIDVDGMTGIEILSISAIDVVDKYGERHDFKT